MSEQNTSQNENEYRVNRESQQYWQDTNQNENTEANYPDFEADYAENDVDYEEIDEENDAEIYEETTQE